MKPTHKIRISNISAVIWRNLGERGNWYSVQIIRGYKTDDGWRNTDYFGADDLLNVAKVADMAHTWITHQLAADAKGRKESDTVTAK